MRKTRKCSRCKDEKPISEFSGKDKYCRPCRCEYNKAQRGTGDTPGRPKREIDIGIKRLPKIKPRDLSTRDALDRYLQEELGTDASAYALLIKVNMARLDAAIRTKSAVDIDRAERALRQTVDTKREHQGQLFQKLELLEQFRKGAETKAKPVSFRSWRNPDKSAVVVPVTRPAADELCETGD